MLSVEFVKKALNGFRLGYHLLLKVLHVLAQALAVELDTLGFSGAHKFGHSVNGYFSSTKEEVPDEPTLNRLWLDLVAELQEREARKHIIAEFFAQSPPLGLDHPVELVVIGESS